MGSTIHNNNHQISFKQLTPPLDQYTIARRTPHFTVWNHLLKDQSLIEYNIHANDCFAFHQHIDEFMFRYRHPLLVSTLYLSVRQSTKNGCVYYERVLTNLSKIKNIPFRNALVFFYTALKGFEILFHKFGYFEIKENMLHITNELKVKIWHNYDISTINPVLVKYVPINPQQIMVQRIIQIIIGKCDFSEGGVEFGHSLLRFACNTFQHAISKFQCLCNNERNLKIPDRLTCVNRSNKRIMQMIDQYGERSVNENKIQGIAGQITRNCQFKEPTRKRNRGITLSISKDKQRQDDKLKNTMDFYNLKSTKTSFSSVHLSNTNPAIIRNFSEYMQPLQQAMFVPASVKQIINRNQPVIVSQSACSTPYTYKIYDQQITHKIIPEHRRPLSYFDNSSNQKKCNQANFNTNIKEQISKNSTSSDTVDNNKQNGFVSQLAIYPSGKKIKNIRKISLIKQQDQYFCQSSEQGTSRTKQNPPEKPAEQLSGFKARFEEYKRNFKSKNKKSKENTKLETNVLNQDYYSFKFNKQDKIKSQPISEYCKNLQNTNSFEPNQSNPYDTKSWTNFKGEYTIDIQQQQDRKCMKIIESVFRPFDCKSQQMKEQQYGYGCGKQQNISIKADLYKIK